MIKKILIIFNLILGILVVPSKAAFDIMPEPLFYKIFYLEKFLLKKKETAIFIPPQ